MCTLGTPRATSHENTEGVLALPLHNMHSALRLLKLSPFIFLEFKFHTNEQHWISRKKRPIDILTHLWRNT